MIKYYHELTPGELNQLRNSGITYRELAEQYPQPTWCNYTDAVFDEMGCYSLCGGLVTGEEYCANCDCHRHANERES